MVRTSMFVGDSFFVVHSRFVVYCPGCVWVGIKVNKQMFPCLRLFNRSEKVYSHALVCRFFYFVFFSENIYKYSNVYSKPERFIRLSTVFFLFGNLI